MLLCSRGLFRQDHGCFVFKIMGRKITALKAQKRNSQRINVYLDDEFAFGLSRFAAAWLQIGQELSPKKLKSYRISMLKKSPTNER